MTRIIPSLASANPLFFGDCIKSLGETGALHLDIEDGNFIPNITFGMKTVKAVAAFSGLTLDVHLMTSHPEHYIEELLAADVTRIAFHLENVMYPLPLLHLIRSRGGKAGLALNLQADVQKLLPYADALDYVLLLASEPDGRGQEFNPIIFDRVREARRLMPERVRIAVDGGVSKETMHELARCGAEILIMGRAIWNADEPLAELTSLEKSLRDKGTPSARGM